MTLSTDQIQLDKTQLGQTQLGQTHIDFIRQQTMFFVATAAREGRVNLSPKGMDSLRVLGPDRIVWLNLSGSGNETAAHLRDSDRMTLMFCAFDGPAMILRVYGRARTYHPRDPEWPQLSLLFPAMAGARQIFDVAVEQVAQSCGTGVPLFDPRAERGPGELLPFYERMDEAKLRAYWTKKNLHSIDGQPTGILDDIPVEENN